MLKILRELPTRGRVSWGAIPIDYHNNTLVSEDILPDLKIVGSLAKSLSKASPIGLIVSGLTMATPAGVGSTRSELLDALDYGKRLIAANNITAGALGTARDWIRSMTDDGAAEEERQEEESVSNTAGRTATNTVNPNDDDKNKKKGSWLSRLFRGKDYKPSDGSVKGSEWLPFRGYHQGSGFGNAVRLYRDANALTDIGGFISGASSDEKGGRVDRWFGRQPWQIGYKNAWSLGRALKGYSADESVFDLPLNTKKDSLDKARDIISEQNSEKPDTMPLTNTAVQSKEEKDKDENMSIGAE